MHKVYKGGWNGKAALAGPFWYLSKSMTLKGLFLLALCLVTAGIGIIPVWIYCGAKGNEDHYRFVKAKGYHLHTR